MIKTCFVVASTNEYETVESNYAFSVWFYNPGGSNGLSFYKKIHMVLIYLL